MNQIQKKIAVFPIFLGAGFGAGSVAALANDQLVFGGILGLLAAGAVYGAFNMEAEATCPACAQSFKIDPGSAFVECPHCSQWAQIQSRIVKQVPSDFVAEKPAFEVRMRTLSPSGHGLPDHAVWPTVDQCCVCGKTLDSRRSISVTRETMFGMPVAGRVQARIQTYDVPIPCCSAHANGVTWEISGAFEPKQVSIVTFRSYPYSRAFRSRNSDVVVTPGWGGEGA